MLRQVIFRGHGRTSDGSACYVTKRHAELAQGKSGVVRCPPAFHRAVDTKVRISGVDIA